MKKIFLIIIWSSVAHQIVKAQTPSFPTSSNADLIKAMTLYEKARIIMGLGMDVPAFGPDKMPPDTAKPYNPVDGAAGTTYAIARLKIPAIVLADGPAGLRINPTRANEKNTYYCTAFPIGTLLASSWNPTVVKNVGNAIGNEVAFYGANVLLAPAINIHRNPLGGRNFEYYSEDPVVSGKIGAAYIMGVQKNNVGTSIKHFAANNHEANRMNIDVQMTQRTLREIYLRGFEIVVKEAKPWTLMSSYNKINGTYTSQSNDLITTILQKEWGYKGLVMTDWFAGDNGAAQMAAGNHMIMPGTKKQLDDIINAVNNGTLKIESLNENVDRVLNLIRQSQKIATLKTIRNKTQNAAVSRMAATEGMILLKNENSSLPLNKPATKIALYGNMSYRTVIGGTGSGDVNKEYSVSIADGFVKAGYQVNNDIIKAYNNHLIESDKNIKPPAMWFMPKELPQEMDIAIATLQNEAATNDVAILTIGRTSGEFEDRALSNFYLSDKEKTLVKNISDAYHAKGKKLIVLLNIGGIIEMASWQAAADAILVTWQPGQEAGHAIADIVSGKVNPSGKLATTIPVDYNDLSTANGFPGTPAAMPTSITYNEGVYVGYRYFEKATKPVVYEFGFGKSYTNFNISNIKLTNSIFKNQIGVSVTVTNTGKVAGKEVVQLYLGAPSANTDFSKPVKELKAFMKTTLLAPQQSQVIQFTISKRDLCSFNEAQSAWVADAGKYEVLIGSSSKNIAQKAAFTLPQTMVVEKVNNVLAPINNINTLKL
ncbi:beta-glucosidase [Ferruginibacter yonginensis]|uniref:Beta-glucosidase n=1 Tax=Ferruginibacter yonginensis TaxID=1310416 RepID=A0ABV8QT60_9BACT